MKKMVCEICGSQTIRKENGVFVCQECGTEYSVEEAKKLLKDIEEPKPAKTNETKRKSTSSQDDKDKLIYSLYCWANNIVRFPDPLFWLGIKSINNKEFWQNTLLELGQKTIKFEGIFIEDLLDLADNSFFSSERNIKRFYDCKLIDYIEKEVIKDKKIEKTLSSFFKQYGREFYIKWYSDKYSSNYKLLSLFLTEQIGQNENEQPCVYSLAYEKERQKEARHQITKTLYDTKEGFFGTKYFNAPSQVQSTYNSLLSRAHACVSGFIDKHNEMMRYCEDHFTEICDVYKEVNDCCLKLEKEFFLPYEYRNIQIIFELIDLVKEGKAKNWQELANLYDTKKFRAGVYERLDLVNAKLDSIQNTLIVGFTTISDQLTQFQKQLNSIDKKLNNIKLGINKIKNYSFVTMWNSL